MKTRIRFKLTAFTFVVLLLLPILDQLTGLSARFSSTENRQLRQMPLLNFPHVRSFAHQFDPYYKENFGWRNALFYLYSRWKFCLLGVSPLPEKVVIGKKGWLFLGNTGNKVLDQHRGLQPLSVDSAQLIVNHLVQRQRELKQQGVELYVLVAPDAHTIYDEYLPDYLQRKATVSRLDILEREAAKTDLRFTDLRDTLQAAKGHHVVYYQTDTHWNEYGTLVGCATLLKAIKHNRPTLPPIRLSDYHIQKQRRGVSGDLINMMMLQDQYPTDAFCYTIEPAPSRVGRQIAVVPNKETALPSTRFTGAGSDKLLLIGDSFSEGMMQYLSGYFRESYFVRGRQLDRALVKTEHPAIVVIEIVERNISQLARF